MTAIEHRFIAGLAPESKLWVRSASRSTKPAWSRLHLLQSDLDGGCGVHCIGMGLMIINGTSRTEVLRLTTAKSGPLAAFWRAASADYFSGADGRELLSYVNAMGAGLEASRVRGSALKLVQATTEAILSDQVTILRVEGPGFDHWTLVPGYEREVGADGQTLALLTLDPGEQEPWLAASNGRIDVAPRVHKRTSAQQSSRSFRYRSLSGECCTVKLVEVVVLRRARSPP